MAFLRMLQQHLPRRVSDLDRFYDRSQTPIGLTVVESEHVREGVKGISPTAGHTGGKTRRLLILTRMKSGHAKT